MKIDYEWTVAKEGYIPILVSIFITWISTAFLGVSIFSLIFFILLLLVIYFFRDPDRILLDKNGLTSPADGKIISVDLYKETEFLNKEMTRVCIFLSIFDCHINRAPTEVQIVETRYYPGAFFFANSSRCIENERFYIKSGDFLNKADRLGIIKFGSRVDIYVPNDYSCNFKEGDSVVAVESLLFEKDEK